MLVLNKWLDKKTFTSFPEWRSFHYYRKWGNLLTPWKFVRITLQLLSKCARKKNYSSRMQRNVWMSRAGWVKSRLCWRFQSRAQNVACRGSKTVWTARVNLGGRCGVGACSWASYLQLHVLKQRKLLLRHTLTNQFKSCLGVGSSERTALCAPTSHQ